ncbi:hypothetical protein CEXT_648231 [Caerostris extrusa]|uniref:HNH homing endonuclease n=1 Tax=Caerostris extrusa TaxID=172846 RepID=A0AAV4X9F2_CAEEX|nr:hypothetical protein CEXT_648231 [Caerostris extrusa]
MTTPTNGHGSRAQKITVTVTDGTRHCNVDTSFICVVFYFITPRARYHMWIVFSLVRKTRHSKTLHQTRLFTRKTKWEDVHRKELKRCLKKNCKSLESRKIPRANRKGKPDIRKLSNQTLLCEKQNGEDVHRKELERGLKKSCKVCETAKIPRANRKAENTCLKKNTKNKIDHFVNGAL